MHNLVDIAIYTHRHCSSSADTPSLQLQCRHTLTTATVQTHPHYSYNADTPSLQLHCRHTLTNYCLMQHTTYVHMSYYNKLFVFRRIHRTRWKSSKRDSVPTDDTKGQSRVAKQKVGVGGRRWAYYGLQSYG